MSPHSHDKQMELILDPGQEPEDMPSGVFKFCPINDEGGCEWKTIERHSDRVVLEYVGPMEPASG